MGISSIAEIAEPTVGRRLNKRKRGEGKKRRKRGRRKTMSEWRNGEISLFLLFIPVDYGQNLTQETDVHHAVHGPCVHERTCRNGALVQ